jgi:polyphenol oxidase
MSDNNQNVTFYTPANLASIQGLKCGCFSRFGGVSSGIFNSLNTSFSSGDALSNITTNIARACTAIDVDPTRLIGASLVHGDNIITISSSDQICGSFTNTGRFQLPKADGIICSVPGHYIMMSTADCALVILVVPSHKIVAMFHAGWKGIVNRIVPKGIAKVITEFSIKTDEIQIAIMPSIGPCCYRLKDPIQRTIPEWRKYLLNGTDGLVSLDLQQALYDQVMNEGFKPEQVSFDRTCTSCRKDIYFSYYAERPKTGRMPTIVGFS